MDLELPAVPVKPIERDLKLIKQRKSPKIEIKLITRVISEEVEEVPEVLSAPSSESKQGSNKIPSDKVTRAQRPNIPPASNKNEHQHRKVFQPAAKKNEVNKVTQRREYVNIAKPLHILPPSDRNGTSQGSPSGSKSPSSALAAAAPVSNTIVSELPVKSVSLNVTPSPNKLKNSLPAKKSGYVNHVNALKGRNDLIKQTYASNEVILTDLTPISPTPISSSSPNNLHSGLAAVDANNLKKLDSLTFGVKEDDYPALKNAIQSVSPKRPAVVRPGAFHGLVVRDDNEVVAMSPESEKKASEINNNNDEAVSLEVRTGVISRGYIIHIPSPGALEFDSTINSGANSPIQDMLSYGAHPSLKQSPTSRENSREKGHIVAEIDQESVEEEILEEIDPIDLSTEYDEGAVRNAASTNNEEVGKTGKDI